MLEVESKQLNVIFPSTHIRIVLMQPQIFLSDIEPFNWPEEKKQEQLSGIRRTFDIAKRDRAHFTLFPEYAIPGLDGVNEINDIVAEDDWSNNSIIIGGIDGLNKNQYQQLLIQPNTYCHSLNSPNNVGDNDWVNCSVTWVKNANGLLEKYVQLKISPAWPERNIQLQEMFCGKASYVFSASYDNDFPCRFISFICFDWIGKIKDTNEKVIDSFLNSMNTTCGGNPQQLHWIFVLQENNDPNNDLFVQETSRFLTQRSQHTMVDRSKSAILLINNSRKNNGPYRAFTSCVFPEDVSLDTVGCPPTYSFASDKLRGKDINRCRDIIFRELKPCIHSFNVKVIQFLDLTPDSRCHPLEDASVHAIDEQTIDARFPGAPVPACIKWVNDMLDITRPISNTVTIDHLSTEASTSHNDIVTVMRQLKANKHEQNIHYATASHSYNPKKENWKNVDSWSNEEKNALVYILNTITMIKTIHDINLQDSCLHATIIINYNPVEIVAINGNTHDDCFKHFHENLPKPPAHKTFFISKDRSNSRITPGFLKKFSVPESTQCKITKPGSCYVIRDYQTVLNAFQQADSLETFRQEVTSYVT